MSKPNPQRINVPSVAEDRVINAAAKLDPDAQPLTTRQLAEMVPIAKVRGRPRSPASKQLISVRYSPEVVQFFRATGDGWQARMDDVLKRYVSNQNKRRERGHA